MPSLSFEVGAIFSIDPAPAVSALETIGRAFETLNTALDAGVMETTRAVDRMVGEIARVGEAWRAAAAESRAGGGGRSGGVGGREGGLYGPPDRPYWGEGDDRANAEWENQNYEAQQRRRRLEAMDEDRRLAREGLYGPPVRDRYEGYDEAGRINDRYDVGQRMNADAENADYDRAGRQRAAESARRAAESAGRWKMGNNAFSGMGPFVAPFLGYEAEKGAMTEDRALTQALIELGMSPGDPGFAAEKERLRGRVTAGTLGTIYSESHGASVLPGTAGQYGAALPPGERVTKYEEVLPGALKFAEVAEQYHRGSVTESLKAAFSYANMTHPKTKDDFTHSLDTLLAVALSTGNTVAGEQNTLKYSVPIGQAAGVPSDKIAAVTGFFEMMGMSGTTAGTGVGQLIMGLTNTGGPLAAQQRAHETQRAVERSFEDVLHMKPEALHEVSKSRGNEHVKAMERIGLFDASGHVDKVVAPGGKLNIDEMFTRIEAFLGKTPSIEAMGTLAKAFTVRGSREADLFSDPEMAGRMKTYLEGVLHPKSADQLQKELATTPLQQFEQMLANVSNIGNTLATSTLSPLNDLFKEINAGLISFNIWLKENPLAQQIGGWGLLFAGVTTGLGLFGLGIRAVTTGLGVLTGATQTAAAAMTEAGGAAAAMGLTMRAALLRLAPLLVLSGDTGPDAPPTKDYQAYLNKEHAKFVASNPMTWGADPEHHSGVAPGDPRRQLRSLTDTEHHSGLSPASPLTVNVANTFSGITDVPTMLSKMMDVITSGIAKALSHASSDPHGTDLSPYTSPGWVP